MNKEIWILAFTFDLLMSNMRKYVYFILWYYTYVIKFLLALMLFILFFWEKKKNFFLMQLRLQSLNRACWMMSGVVANQDCLLSVGINFLILCRIETCCWWRTKNLTFPTYIELSKQRVVSSSTSSPNFLKTRHCTCLGPERGTRGWAKLQ